MNYSQENLQTCDRNDVAKLRKLVARSLEQGNGSTKWFHFETILNNEIQMMTINEFDVLGTILNSLRNDDRCLLFDRPSDSEFSAKRREKRSVQKMQQF